MMNINWKLIGMGMSVITAALSLAASVVETNQRRDEIREEVAKELDRREQEKES